MLELNNISKTFLRGTLDEKKALDNISLTIEDGEFVTIIGGNGSGKSTLMNVLCGVYTPDEGNIFIDDIDVTKMNEHKRAKYIGRVFQDPMMGTAKDMSILENLEIAYRRGQSSTFKWNFKKNNRQMYIDELSKFNLGLENRLTQKVGLLSGGQRQVLTLLMATLQRPKFLLLDEHTAALDPKTSRIVMEMTNEIVKENHLTTLMITHNMKDAIKYGDRLIMINGGKIIMDVKGEEKANLTADEIVKKFSESTDTIIDTKLL